MAKEALAAESSLANESSAGETLVGEKNAVDEGEPAWETGGYLIVVFWSASFLLVAIIGNCLHRFNVWFLPESLVAIGAGALIGLLGQSISAVHFTDDIKIEGLVNAAVLNLTLLPIIIFESGWAVNTRDFVTELGYILLFAVVGTVISMFVTVGLLVVTSEHHGITNLRVTFAYSILITAVDPVATLATYSHLNVDPLLNVLVFGEAVINDAVAIAIFRTLNAPSSDLSAETVWKISADILKLFFGSVGLGLLLAGVYVVILRCARMKDTPNLAIIFIFISCFFTYAFSERVCGMSGIITVLFCGMMLRAYATPHLTKEGRLLTSFLLKQLATLADMAVFVFVGVALVFASNSGLLFGLTVMGFCIVSRALAILPLGLATNGCKWAFARSLPPERKHYLSPKHLFMMCHAGLRGGIALVLVLELGDWVDAVQPGAREMLRNGTLVVILGFLILCGGSTEITLKYLGVRMGKDVDSNELLYESHHYSFFMRQLGALNRRVVLPLLVGSHRRDTFMKGSIMEKILHLEAKDEPLRDPSGAELPTLSSTEFTSQERADIHGLFGHGDPTAAGVDEDGVDVSDCMRHSSSSEEEDDL